MSLSISFAICPPPHIVAAGRVFKKELEAQVEEYKSVNSELHNSIITFETEEKMLPSWAHLAREFSKRINPFEIHLDRFGYFINNTVYLAPNEQSGKMLRLFMKSLNSLFHGSEHVKSTTPHFSIGRNLSPEQFAKAKDLFQNRKINLFFLCENLSIRILNLEKMQYTIYESFPFLGDKEGLLF